MMRRQQPNKSSSSSYSSVTQSSVTSGSEKSLDRNGEKSLNRHGYYVDKVLLSEDRRHFSLGAAQRRRHRAQWQDDRGSSRGFVGREPGRGRHNHNDHTVRKSLGGWRNISSSCSISTDSELSHVHGSVHGGIPSGGASYQTFLDDRKPVPKPPSSEEILMNLGMCASCGFIPKRFLCDWVDKTQHLQAQSRQRVSQQWLDTLNACLHQKAQRSETNDSEDGLSIENFESSDINEYCSNSTNNKRYSLADDACNQSVSADAGVTSISGREKGVHSDNGADAQKTSQLKFEPDIRVHSKLLLGHQQDKLREQRCRQFASHRSRSLTAVLLEATTPDWSATMTRKTSPKPSTAAIPVVDSTLRCGPTGSRTVDYVEGEVTNQLIGGDAVHLDVSPHKDRLGVCEHLIVAREYTETNEHIDLMIPIKEETPLSLSMELPSIVIRDSSPLFLHEDSIEVNNILTSPEASMGDCAFQLMLQPTMSLSRTSSLSSSNCSAVSCSPVTVIEVGCSATRNDIANMDMLRNGNETTTMQTPAIVLVDACFDNYECSSGSSPVSATFHDARQWPSSSDIHTSYDATNEEACNPAINELPRCTSVPAYLPSFNVEDFGVEAPLSDSQQNLCVDEDSLFYCFKSIVETDDGSESLSMCAYYQESVSVPSTWSVLASDGDEPTARDFGTQTPASWELAGVSSHVSKYIMPYICGKCQYYITRTCPSDVLSPIERDSDEVSSSSLHTTFIVGNVADIQIITNPSQNGVAKNQATEDRAHGSIHGLFTASNSDANYAPGRAPLSNQRRVGQLGKSAFVELRK